MKLQQCLAIVVVVLGGIASAAAVSGRDPSVLDMGMAAPSSNRSTDDETLRPRDCMEQSSCWNGHTVEVWLGTRSIHVGVFTGSDLYGAIYQVLAHELCPDGGNYAFNSPRYIRVPTGSSKSQQFITITVRDGWYRSDQARRLMIGLVAGAAEAQRDAMEVNCKKGKAGDCNIGDRIKVWAPDHHLHVQLENSRDVGHFDCTDSIYKMWPVMEGLKGEMTEVWGAPYTSMCLCIRAPLP